MSQEPDALERKRNAELRYWTDLSRALTRDCRTPEERREALLQVSRELTFPRYKESLDLEDGSFAGLRVLDLGCGPHGGLIGFHGAERFGADHLLHRYLGLGYPLSEHGVRYASCRSERLPFPADSFDMVLCVNALDHVDDPAETLAEIARVLSDGGRLLAQVNFHLHATATEPHCFTHDELLLACRESDLLLRKIVYQGYVADADEHRYYYELQLRRLDPPSSDRA